MWVGQNRLPHEFFFSLPKYVSMFWWWWWYFFFLFPCFSITPMHFSSIIYEPHISKLRSFTSLKHRVFNATRWFWLLHRKWTFTIAHRTIMETWTVNSEQWTVHFLVAINLRLAFNINSPVAYIIFSLLTPAKWNAGHLCVSINCVCVCVRALDL